MQNTHSIRARLTHAANNGTRSGRAIATFMLNSLKDLPFETATSLALKIQVSEASVGRFCRGIGYANFKVLKDHLKDDMGDQPWLIKDQLDQLRNGSSQREERISQALEMEMAGLVHVYEYAQTPEWARVVERMAKCPRVFVVGFQTDRGLAMYFANQLQYLRDGVQLLDLAAGNFAELLAHDGESCLVMFEGRRYSRQAKVLAAEARARNVPVTLMTDQFCNWGADNSDEMFSVSTQFRQFWDSTAHLAILSNLMLNDVFLDLGVGAEERLVKTARLYGALTGHVGNPLVHIAT